MGIKEYLQFENPGIIAIALGVIMFAGAYVGAEKALKNKPVAMVIGICLGLLTAWGVYEKIPSFSSNVLAVVVIAIALGIVFFLIVPFFRHTKRNFGTR